jgi:lysyl endopeptidase
MKSYLFLIFSVLSTVVVSQTTTLGLPEILKNTVSKTTIFNELPGIDTSDIPSTREKTMEYGKPIRWNKNVLENSKIDTLLDGSVVYQYGIWCKKALSINVVFSHFQLKQGSTIYLVGANSNTYIGAYTSLNNSPSHYLGTDLIYDEKVIIEVKEPLENRNTSIVQLETVVHGYQSIHQLLKRKLNSSGICNIDVNCPQGNGFENQRNAVVLILNGAGGLCTGTMMNSTIGPVKPYMLTALHCGTKPEGWVYRFRWEAPSEQADCGTSTPSVDGPQTMTINGCSLVAKSKATDFLLCELNAMPDPTWNVYFSGWNVSGKTPRSGTGIHHPYADIKKISYDMDSLHTDAFNPGEPTNHWRTNWDQGITEVGSSGSPLFDENHLFIGQLHGGDSDCISDFMTDFYGKMADSWNGLNTDSTRLKTWLDPVNSLQETLDGAYLQGSTPISDDAFLPYVGTNLIKRNCSQSIIPYVIISNAGTNNLTKATISYQFDNESAQSISWTGNLKTYQTDTVFLSSNSFGQGTHTFTATIQTDKDDVLKNNTITHSFEQLNDTKSYTFLLTLDNKGSETNWKITNKSDEVLYSGGPYDNGTPGKVIKQEMCLSPACYSITIHDYNGNGMKDIQAGSMYFVQNDKDTLVSLLPTASFKSSYSKSFCDTIGTSSVDTLKVYPNPVSTDVLTIESTIESVTEITIFDLTGKRFGTYKPAGTLLTINTDFLKQGMYLFEIKTTNHTYVNRVLIQQ